MTEAPKKIWVDWLDYPYAPPIICSTKPDVHSWNGEPYIRADLAHGLIEALKMCVKHLDADGNLWSKEEQTMALAALKALETAETGRGME